MLVNLIFYIISNSKFSTFIIYHSYLSHDSRLDENLDLLEILDVTNN